MVCRDFRSDPFKIGVLSLIKLWETATSKISLSEVILPGCFDSSIETSFCRSPGAVRPNPSTTDQVDILTIIHLGRSVQPLRTFLNTCREFVDQQSRTSTKIRTPRESYGAVAWDTILRPTRPLETIHLDEEIKKDLVEDIEKYLEPENRRFYTERGIPYRKGYLLYGPPGTGKLGLKVHLLHLPSLRTDRELEAVFMSLPAPAPPPLSLLCVVVLEDIDAIGINKRSSEDDDNKGNNYLPGTQYGPPLTLSGLLNVLDGA